MNEKIKKVFEGVTANLVFAWVFIAMFIYTIIVGIIEASEVACIVALPFLLIAMLAYELHKKEQELSEAKHIAVVSTLTGIKVGNELERYKKLYGELPPEEETEKKEETKEE